jgi:hypothetical protein
MEIPQFEKHIEKQNDRYAGIIQGWYIDKPRNGLHVLGAISDAFIMGAGGLEGSFDAAATLRFGGLELLLKKLELDSIDPEAELDEDRFDEVIRASIAYGVSWDLLDDELHASRTET